MLVELIKTGRVSNHSLMQSQRTGGWELGSPTMMSYVRDIYDGLVSCCPAAGLAEDDGVLVDLTSSMKALVPLGSEADGGSDGGGDGSSSSSSTGAGFGQDVWALLRSNSAVTSGSCSSNNNNCSSSSTVRRRVDVLRAVMDG